MNGRHRVLLVLVFCVAGLLRFVALGRESLWYDEVYSLDAITWPLSTMLTVRDGHPPLFHLLLRGLEPITGELSGRILSAGFGTATVVLMPTLARAFGFGGAGLVATALLALSPVHVWYSREGRMYALYVLLAVISSILFSHAVRSGRPRIVFAWVLAVLAGLLTHYGFVAVAVAQLVVFAGRRFAGRRGAGALVPLAAVGGVFALGLIPMIREVTLGPIGPQRESSPLALAYTLYVFASGFGVGPPLADLHWTSGLSALGGYGAELAIGGMATAVLAAAVFAGVRRQSELRAYLILWLVLGPVLFFGRSLLGGGAYNVRYVLGSLPPFLLLAAAGLRIARPNVRAVAVGVVAVAAVLSIGRPFVDARYQREPIREAAEFLRRHARDGDRIAVAAGYQALTLGHFLGRDRAIEPLVTTTIHSAEEAARLVERLRRSNARTWVVLSRHWDVDPARHLEQALLRGAQPTPRFVRPGVFVLLVERTL